MKVSIRPACAEDVDFLVELYADEDVRPFLAAGGAYDRSGVAAKVAQEGDAGGLMIVELDGQPAGAMAWELANRRSAIVRVGGLAIDPRFRGRRLADDAARLFQRYLILERGFHRIELEVYGFNERAQRHAERSGFAREGVKRQAYRRGEGWVDSVLYALVAEDLNGARVVARGPCGGRAMVSDVSAAQHWDWSLRVFDHLDLHASDYAESVRFYEAVLAPLGIPKLSEHEGGTCFANLNVVDRHPPTQNLHLCFYAREKAHVDAFHRAGVDVGFRSNGLPGYRDYAPGYYAAYLLDPDGNNVEALYRDIGNIGHGAGPTLR